MIVSFTRISGNEKTGPIPNTVTESASCPTSCPYNHNNEGGCYARGGHLNIIWTALDNGGSHPTKPEKIRVHPRTWDEMCAEVAELPRGQVWRHNSAGDLPGRGDYIDRQKLDQLVQANKKARAMGFTYTHKPVNWSVSGLMNASAIYDANREGFRINLSADSLTEADDLYDMDIGPVVVVLPSDAPRKGLRTPKGRVIVSCPAEEKKVLHSGKKVPAITCDRCKLCAKERKSIVGFHAHGIMKERVNRTVRRLNVLHESQHGE